MISSRMGPTGPGIQNLGQFSQGVGITHLDFVCTRCGLGGSRDVSLLISKYGALMRLDELRRIFAGKCERMAADRRHDPCLLTFPQLR